MKKKDVDKVKKLIPEFLVHLEDEAALITEAIGDIIYIANHNSYEVAMELIRTQFAVIDLQDVDADNNGITLQ